MCHPPFVEDDDRFFAEIELAVVEPPDKVGERAGLGYPSLAAEVTGRLARRGGADDFIAGTLEGLGHGPEHGRLAGASHTHDQLRPPPRGTDANGRCPLLLGELGAELLLSLFNGFFDGFERHCRGIGTGQQVGQALGDGGFPSQHGGQRMHSFPGAGQAGQGYDFGVGHGPVDEPLKHFWGLAEQVRGERHDHVTAGENLPAGQVLVRS